jgi:hypothetical protein
MSDPSLGPISNPEDKASKAQLRLMTYFGIGCNQHTTRGAARAKLDAYFAEHPEEHNAYLARRSARSKDEWQGLVKRRHAKAVEVRGELAATEGQIAGVLKRAFKLPEGDRRRIDALSALKNGATRRQADVLIRILDGRYVARPPSPLPRAA